MTYRDLRKIFHSNPQAYDSEYEARFNSPQTRKIGFDVSGSPAFFVMTPEIYQAELAAARLDKELYQLCLSLPGKAIESYQESNLIDEIVIFDAAVTDTLDVILRIDVGPPLHIDQIIAQFDGHARIVPQRIDAQTK